jgi:O-antigen/teichoic acid export membrane protein
MALLKEIRYTFLAHIFNVLVPLLLIPVLVHRLGDLQFGRFVILVGTSAYLAYLIELGFNNVAIERFSSASSEGQRRIFMAVLIVKTVLAVLVCAVGVAAYSNLLESWGWNQQMAWLLVAPPVTCILYPAWFFVIQKRQKLNFLIQVSTKLFLLAGVLAFVHMPQDAPAAVGIYAVSVLVVALPFASNWTGYVSLKDMPGREEILEIMGAGFKASGLAVRDAWSANGLAPILGLFLSSHGVAEFALAEKIARSLTAPASMVGSVMLANHTAVKGLIDTLRRRAGIIVFALLALYLIGISIVKLMTAKFFVKYAGPVDLFLLMSGSVVCAYFNYSLLNIVYILRRRYFSLTFTVLCQCAVTILIAGFFGYHDQWAEAALAISVIEMLTLLILSAQVWRARRLQNDGASELSSMPARDIA